MWTVNERKDIARELGKAPEQIRKKYEVWKDIVTHSGPLGLARIRGFNDEALAAPWKGYRSSRLNEAYRVIYKVEGKSLSVTVERVSKHDYRK